MLPFDDVKKIVLLMTIGLCEALRSKAISFDDAERCLFAPHTMELLKKDVQIKEIIHICTEFGDIARLVPDALDEAIVDAKQKALALLSTLPPSDPQQDRWLNKLFEK